MRSYGQYCPIARASELLGERWTFIVVRNILIGCRTFNEIAEGVPGMSRGLLSKRLRELERAGVLEINAKEDGPGSTYEPTQAGQELWDVLVAMQRWGARWAELAPEHTHPGMVMWAWGRRYVRAENLPRKRVLVRFDFPTVARGVHRVWMLVERGAAEMCERHPGGEEDAVIRVCDPLAFARWHLGDLEWNAALASGAIEADGPRSVLRAIPTWHHPARPSALHPIQTLN